MRADGGGRFGSGLTELVDRTEVVLFDFDMTLVDSSDGVTFGLRSLAARFGLRKPERDEIFSTIGFPMPEAMEKLWGTCSEEWLEYYRVELSPLERGFLRPLPGVVDLLETLGSIGVSCGVVSNRRTLGEVIAEFRWDVFFRTVLVLDDGLPPKPDPASLLLAMGRLGGSKDDTIYVGDSLIDVEAARRAGVACFAVTTGAARGRVLRSAGADAVFGSCVKIDDLFSRRVPERIRKGNDA